MKLSHTREKLALYQSCESYLIQFMNHRVRSGGGIIASRIAWSAEGGADVRSAATASSANPLGGMLRLVGGLAVAPSADGTALCTAPLSGTANVTCQALDPTLGSSGAAAAAGGGGGGAGLVVAGAAGVAIFAAGNELMRQLAVFPGASPQTAIVNHCFVGLRTARSVSARLEPQSQRVLPRNAGSLSYSLTMRDTPQSALECQNW